jgi:hypothetical protein
MYYLKHVFLKHVGCSIQVFIFGIFLVWVYYFAGASIYCLLNSDTSYFSKALYHVDPRNFLWMRIATVIWVGASILIGRILSELMP